MTTAQRITTSIAVALTLATSAAPASARPFDLDGNGTYVPAPLASTQAHGQATSMRGRPVGSAPLTVRATGSDNGFDWGDAGVGAAGGVALCMIGLGGALSVSHRRTRQPHHTTAITH